MEQTMPEMSNAECEQKMLTDLINALRKDKPNDRSETDRHYAILITDLEKAFAYHDLFIWKSWFNQEKAKESHEY